MSREHIAALEWFYEAFNAGGDVGSLRVFADPEFTYSTREEFPEGGSYGLEEALDRISVLREVFDEIRWEPQEFIDGGERVVVVVRQIARGRTSGVSTDQSIAHVWLIEAGKAKELCVFSRRADALESVGMGAEGTDGYRKHRPSPR
jgi:ketosteroid isomerase-like protein